MSFAVESGFASSAFLEFSFGFQVVEPKAAIWIYFDHCLPRAVFHSGYSSAKPREALLLPLSCSQ